MPWLELLPLVTHQDDLIQSDDVIDLEADDDLRALDLGGHCI